jgi:hypothetical protein
MRLLSLCAALPALGVSMRRVALAVVAALLVAAPAAGAAPRLVVERTGGFAGVHDRLVIGPTGAATVTHRNGATERLAASRTRAARRALREARFPTLAAVYKPRLMVNDGFVYVLRSSGHRVRVEQGAENVPRRLRDLLDAVGPLLQR